MVHLIEPVQPDAGIGEGIVKDGPVAGMAADADQQFIGEITPFHRGTARQRMCAMAGQHEGIIHQGREGQVEVGRPHRDGVAGQSLSDQREQGAQQDGGGNYLRSIIKTADPERYGIKIGDYFV